MKIFTINTKQIARMFSALVAILLISVQLSSAQSQSVRGVVLDENSNPIIGANVIIQGTTSGVTTGIDGDFMINVAPNQILEFSYVGYRTVEETISAARTNIEVSLMPAAVDLEEVVVVGYNTQSRITMTGSVTSVKAEELETVAAQDISTALTGQMPGVTVIQNSGWAGETDATIRIRGVSSDSDNDPLVLVDGFERSLNDVDMSEVESISVLKDASSTAVYGVQGANGVIIITTKRGVASEKIRFTFKAEGGVNIMGQAPEMLDSYQFAVLYNEGVDNDNAHGGTSYAKFSDEEVQWYKDGTRPLAYPVTNLRDWAFNKVGYQQKYTLTMQGGSDRVKYFNSIAYNYQKDGVKDYGNGYDASSWYDKVNMRSNIDAQLSKTTTLSFNLGAQFTTRNQPNEDLDDLQYYLSCARPGLYSGIIDGKVVKSDIGYYSGSGEGSSIYTYFYDAGYNKLRTNKIQATLNLKQDLSFLTKGLTANLYYTYDNSSRTLFTFNNTPSVYYLRDDGYNTATGTFDSNIIIEAPSSIAEASPARTCPSGTSYDTDVDMKFRAMLNYNTKIKNDHSISALAVFNATDKSFHNNTSNYDVPYRTIEIASKISYNYKSRYLFDVNLGVSGSENFHPDNRYGFFPAASVGWVASSEKWFPKNDILTFMKLKGSYGITGDDGSVGRFYYEGTYTIAYTGNNGYLFGEEMGGVGQGYTTEGRSANPELTWQKNYQTNIGISTQWFKDRLNIEAEVYRNERKDILMTPTDVSSVLGISTLASVNMKELTAQGYEISANWSDNVGKFNYSIGGSFSYYENKIVEMGELEPDFEWQRQTGQSISTYNAWTYDGLYTQADIDQLTANSNVGTAELPTGYLGYIPCVGDVKYKDFDGDGNITSNDKSYLDYQTVAPYSFSINASLNYKNWGLSMLWQGTTGASYVYQNYLRYPFQNGNNNSSTITLERWSPDNPDSKYPRVTTLATSTHSNYINSDLWLDDSKYIRLKTLEVSYKFSSAAVKKMRMSSMRIYASGYNLLTFTALDFCDPETSSGSSVPIPPNKVFNLGVQIGF